MKAKKRNKYDELAGDQGNLYMRVTVIQIVMGSLEAVAKSLEMWLEDFEIRE